MTTNYDGARSNGFIPNGNPETTTLPSVPRTSTPRFNPRQPEAVLSKTATLRQVVMVSSSVIEELRSIDRLIGAEVEHQAIRAIDAADQADVFAKNEHDDFVCLERARQQRSALEQPKLEALQRELDTMPERRELAQREVRSELAANHSEQTEERVRILALHETAVEELEEDRKVALAPLNEAVVMAEAAELEARGAANAILAVGADPTPITSRDATLMAGDAGALGVETLVVKSVFAQRSAFLKEALITVGFGILFGLNFATLFFKIPANQIGVRFEIQPLEITAGAILGLVFAMILGVPAHASARKIGFTRQMNHGFLPSAEQRAGRERWLQVLTWIIFVGSIATVLIESSVNYGGLAGDRLAALAQLQAEANGKLPSGDDAGLHLSLMMLCLLSGFSLIAYKATTGFGEGEVAASTVQVDNHRANIAQVTLDRPEHQIARELTGRTIAAQRELTRADAPWAEKRSRLDTTRPAELESLEAQQAHEIEREIGVRIARIESETSNLKERMTEIKRDLQADQVNLDAKIAEASQRIEDAFSRAESATERFDRVRAAAIAGCDRQYLAGLIATFDQTVIMPGGTRRKPAWLRALERLFKRTTLTPKTRNVSKDLN
jgi:hypothetical protein